MFLGHISAVVAYRTKPGSMKKFLMNSESFLARHTRLKHLLSSITILLTPACIDVKNYINAQIQYLQNSIIQVFQE